VKEGLSPPWSRSAGGQPEQLSLLRPVQGDGFAKGFDGDVDRLGAREDGFGDARDSEVSLTTTSATRRDGSPEYLDTTPALPWRQSIGHIGHGPSVTEVVVHEIFLALLEWPITGEDDAILLRVTIPQDNHLFESRGLPLTEVGGFRWIVPEVEQLPLAAATRRAKYIQNLPVTLPNGVVAEHLPTDPVLLVADRIGVAGKQGNERFALQAGNPAA